MRLLLILTALLFATLIAGCSDDPTETTIDDLPGISPADSIASYWMEAFADTIQSWSDREMEYEDIKDLTLTELRTGFEAALAEDAANGTGHLGLALVSIMELNYSGQLWAFLDSLEARVGGDDRGDPVPPALGLAYPLRDGLVGHQFRILAEAPVSLVAQAMEMPDNLTVAELQRILNEDLMPKIATALSHLADVEADAGFLFTGVVDEDDFEIDLGEVYFFDASLHVMRAGLRVLLGYNMELVDGAGSYDWIEEMDEFDNPYEFYFLTPDPPDDILHRYWVRNSAQQDSLILTVLQANVVEEGPFLTLRDDPYSGETMLQQAGVDLTTALDKLEAGLAYIRAEEDDQSDDIIELGFLTDLDTDIDECGDCPNFMTGWTEIEDVIAWIEEVLGGPYLLSEEIDGRPISVTVDLYQLFSNPVEDWKTLLPLHEWSPADEWVDRDLYNWNWESRNPDDPYEFWFLAEGVEEEELITLYDISEVYFWDLQEHINEPLTMTDELGDPLGENVLPYFDDYTFNGLLPGMTRTDMANLLDLNP